MKQIRKVEPQFFKDYVNNSKPANCGILSRDIGNDVRTYMLSGMTPDSEENIPSEQNYQCAYTELDIEPEGNISHVDHFRKQSMFQSHRYIFDWNNLFTACNNENIGAKYKDKNIKQSDYQYLINPASENPNDYLTYSLLGDFLEKSDNMDSVEYIKAKTMIDLFNLNDYSLKQQRLTVSKQVQNMCELLSLEEIKNEIGRFDNFIEFVYNACVEIN